MSRDEFIDDYVTRSGIARYRTELGFRFGEHESVALPCRCGEDTCEGWAMVDADRVRWHLFQNTDVDDSQPTTLHSATEGLEMALAFYATGRLAGQALERRGREEGWRPSGGAVSDGPPHDR